MQIPNPRISPIYPCQSKMIQSPIKSHPHPLELSLKPLTLEPQQNPSRTIDFMISDCFSPTSSQLYSGDYLGSESCVDILNVNVDKMDSMSRDCHDPYTQREERSLRWAPKTKKNFQEFPPPMPLLARTENLPAHMPWVLKRHYTNDGRLILTEEKVRHHEYFKAHRSNGRLRLQLVLMDGQNLASPIVPDDIDNDDDEDLDDDEECCSEFDQYEDDEFYDDDVDSYDDHDHEGFEEIIISSGKCLAINSVGKGSPSISGVPVPAIRWVNNEGSKANIDTNRAPSKGFLWKAGFGCLLRKNAGLAAVGAVSKPIRISISNVAELSAIIMFAAAIAWKKGWLRYGWKRILSWSYILSLNPILLLGLCLLSDIVLI